MLKGLLNTAVRAALSHNCHEYRQLFSTATFLVSARRPSARRRVHRAKNVSFGIRIISCTRRGFSQARTSWTYCLPERVEERIGVFFSPQFLCYSNRVTVLIAQFFEKLTVFAITECIQTGSKADEVRVYWMPTCHSAPAGPREENAGLSGIAGARRDLHDFDITRQY